MKANLGVEPKLPDGPLGYGHRNFEQTFVIPETSSLGAQAPGARRGAPFRERPSLSIHHAPLSQSCTAQPLERGTFVSKDRDRNTAVASDVFENVIYCLDPCHDGHFQAWISTTCKLDSRLEFLKGTHGI